MLYREPGRHPFRRMARWLRMRLRPRRTTRLTDFRDLTPYMRWDIGITDVAPTDRPWR